MVTSAVGGERSPSNWHHDPETERMLLLKIGEVKPLFISPFLRWYSSSAATTPISRAGIGCCIHPSRGGLSVGKAAVRRVVVRRDRRCCRRESPSQRAPSTVLGRVRCGCAPRPCEARRRVLRLLH